MVESEVGAGGSSGGPKWWEITEITNVGGIKLLSQPGTEDRRKEAKHAVRNRKVYYMVESPEGSPERDREAITIQTGLSPLLQKVNLKRKYEEESESEGEYIGEHRVER